MSKSSTSVNRKALKLDNKVKAINHCDVGKSCRAVGEEMGVGRTQIMNMLKRKSEIGDLYMKGFDFSTK
jgi:transposase